jgi:hypothetical protein
MRPKCVKKHQRKITYDLFAHSIFLRSTFTSMIRTGFFLILLFSTFAAVNTFFDPFTKSEQQRRKESHIQHNTESNVQAIVLQEQNNPMLYLLRVSVGGRPVFEKRPENYWFHVGDPIVADLDGNGLDDVVKNFYPGSQGYSFRCTLMIFSQYFYGKFNEFVLPVERFVENDIFDLDGDGVYEIITSCLVKYRAHNYWVYRCWHVNGQKLVNVDRTYNFPRAILFTKRSYPTHKTTRELESSETVSQIMKNYPNSEILGNISRQRD